MNQERIRLHGWIKIRPFIEKDGRDTHGSGHADRRRHAITDNGEVRDAHAVNAVGADVVRGRAGVAVTNRRHIDMVI